MTTKETIIILVMFNVILFYYVVEKSKRTLPSSEELNQLIEHDDSIAKQNAHGNDTKYILFWTKMFASSNFYFGKQSPPDSGYKLFEGCKYSNCYSTMNRSLIPVDQFHAIAFHGTEYDKRKHGVPEKRAPHQRYIFGNLESPIYTFADLTDYNNFYNWTMTYRRDSDIYRPYGRVVENTTDYKMPSEDFINNKTKLVAWFVSRCSSQSKRESFVKQLQTFIPVDIYGSCGTLKCPRTKDDNCYHMIEKDYMFYLSFENSWCREYVTEKMYKMLKWNIVPVVRGWEDYNDITPPNSVINANEFESPEELAKYLKHLSENRKEYVKFFEWKKDYTINVHFKKTICELCEKMNIPINRHTAYENINEWWHGKSNEICKEP